MVKKIQGLALDFLTASNPTSRRLRWG